MMVQTTEAVYRDDRYGGFETASGIPCNEDGWYDDGQVDDGYYDNRYPVKHASDHYYDERDRHNNHQSSHGRHNGHRPIIHGRGTNQQGGYVATPSRYDNANNGYHDKDLVHPNGGNNQQPVDNRSPHVNTDSVGFGMNELNNHKWESTKITRDDYDKAQSAIDEFMATFSTSQTGSFKDSLRGNTDELNVFTVTAIGIIVNNPQEDAPVIITALVTLLIAATNGVSSEDADAMLNNIAFIRQCMYRGVKNDPNGDVIMNYVGCSNNITEFDIFNEINFKRIDYSNDSSVLCATDAVVNAYVLDKSLVQVNDSLDLAVKVTPEDTEVLKYLISQSKDLDYATMITMLSNNKVFSKPLAKAVQVGAFKIATIISKIVNHYIDSDIEIDNNVYNEMGDFLGAIKEYAPDKEKAYMESVMSSLDVKFTLSKTTSKTQLVNTCFGVSKTIYIIDDPKLKVLLNHLKGISVGPSEILTSMFPKNGNIVGFHTSTGVDLGSFLNIEGTLASI